MATEFDPIQVEVWRHLFASIAEEMGATLERTGYSPNIKERRDHSCALFDSEGRLLAQAAHIPVHLGAMPLMMQRLRHTVAWTPGTMWLCNDPLHGGTHLPDFTLVAPVFLTDDRRRMTDDGRNTSFIGDQSSVIGHPSPVIGHPLSATRQPTLVGFVANRAHHADIGGLSPGSLPLSTELFHEGIILPPVRLIVRHKLNPDVLALVCANSRTPAERRGDLAAQVSANRTGARRFQELIERYGQTMVQLRAGEAMRYTEAVIRSTLSAAPAGEYEFTDYLDDDGAGTLDLPIHVTVRLKGGRITLDFSGTAPEAAGSVNCTEAVTRSACYYVIRCLAREEVPMNEGLFAAVEVIAPEGTLVNAGFPRAVAVGNTETSQRIVDVVLGALQPAFRDRISAQSQGTMNNVTIGGFDTIRNAQFAYYETICGGAGGGPEGSGATAIHSHMTNTRNTPIEALEMHYPLRVREYAIREGSGGDGENPGGDGVVRSIELLAPAHVSLLTERRRYAPGEAGTTGGRGAGKRGRNLASRPSGDEEELPGKVSGQFEAGTVLTVQTPGGAGWNQARTVRGAKPPRY